MPKDIHNIQKIVFEMVSQDDKTAYKLQNEISAIWQDQITQTLDELFDEFNNDNFIVRIDRIEIDLGTIDRKELERELATKIRMELTPILLDLIKNHKTPKKATNKRATTNNAVNDNVLHLGNAKIEAIEYIPKKTGTIELFLVFLQKGYLPWWSPDYGFQEIEHQIIDSIKNKPETIWQIQKILAKDPVYLQRLIHEHSENFVAFIVDRIILPSGIMAEARTLIRCFEISFKPSTTLRNNIYAHSIYELITQVIAPSGNKKTDKQHQHPRERIFKETFEFLIKKYKQEKVATLVQLQKNPLVSNWLTANQPQKIKESVNVLFKKLLENASGKAGEYLPATSKSNDPLFKEKDKGDNSEKGTEKYAPDPDPNQIQEPEENEAIYIKYAGLVLLHPFYKSFFEHCGLLEKNDFKDEKSRQKALRLLDFITSGREPSPEHELTLHKLFCGIPVSQPIEKPTLSANEKEEAEALIKAAISHWKALKNTSVQGFREAFLNRKGKLQCHNDNWVLQVEKEPYDVLLDQLPWSIIMIKQPWNNYILNVEWY